MSSGVEVQPEVGQGAIRPRRRSVTVLLVVCAVLAVGLTVVGRPFCERPVDVRLILEPRGPSGPPPPAPAGTIAMPPPAVDVWKSAVKAFLSLKRSDEVSYPAHVGLAAGLGVFGCAPEAIAVQWLKAGSHAQTADQRARVDTGLRRQAERLGGSDALRAFLSPHVYSQSDPRAAATLGRVGGQPASDPGRVTTP